MAEPDDTAQRRGFLRQAVGVGGSIPLAAGLGGAAAATLAPPAAAQPAAPAAPAAPQPLIGYVSFSQDEAAFMLVCVGSALVMLVSMYGFADVQGGPHVVLDPSRVASQVVSGISFLGAGTILLLRQEVIRGLITAASLWTIAAVGLAVGGGLYLAAAATTVCAVVILTMVKPLEQRLFKRPQRRQLTVLVARGVASLAEIEAVADTVGVAVAEFQRAAQRGWRARRSPHRLRPQRAEGRDAARGGSAAGDGRGA